MIDDGSEGGEPIYDHFIFLDTASGTLGKTQIDLIEDGVLDGWYKYRHTFVFSHTNLFRPSSMHSVLSPLRESVLRKKSVPLSCWCLRLSCSPCRLLWHKMPVRGALTGRRRHCATGFCSLWRSERSCSTCPSSTARNWPFCSPRIWMWRQPARTISRPTPSTVCLHRFSSVLSGFLTASA